MTIETIKEQIFEAHKHEAISQLEATLSEVAAQAEQHETRKAEAIAAIAAQFDADFAELETRRVSLAGLLSQLKPQEAVVVPVEEVRTDVEVPVEVV